MVLMGKDGGTGISTMTKALAFDIAERLIFKGEIAQAQGDPRIALLWGGSYRALEKGCDAVRVMEEFKPNSSMKYHGSPEETQLQT